jgi:signal transduction protein with GAF and PtsI domain
MPQARCSSPVNATGTERVDDTNVLYAILQEHGVCSLLGVPLLIGGTVIGVLHVGSLLPREFSEDDVNLPTGWLCLVIGDVVGRGLGAAEVMGRLRSPLRAYALLSKDPVEVLTR